MQLKYNNTFSKVFYESVLKVIFLVQSKMFWFSAKDLKLSKTILDLRTVIRLLRKSENSSTHCTFRVGLSCSYTDTSLLCFVDYILVRKVPEQFISFLHVPQPENQPGLVTTVYIYIRTVSSYFLLCSGKSLPGLGQKSRVLRVQVALPK